MAYVSVEELREECVDERDADDDRLSALIEMASRQFDKWTGRFFEPRSMQFRVSGRGNKAILLEQPIISISSLTLDPAGDPYDPTGYVVYNRHLSGLLSPDDRLAPKIELIQTSNYGMRTDVLRPPWFFPIGQQNIYVAGTFGWTDPDGTATGRTPLLVKRAVMLLAVRMLPKVGDTDARSEATFSARVIEERTRDQSYKLDGKTGVGEYAGRFTGDLEVDGIIQMFRRGVSVGVV